MTPHASLLVTAGIGGLAVLVAAAFLAGVARVDRARLVRAAAGVAAWMAVWLGLSAAGVLARFDARPPPALALFAGTLIAGVWIGSSRLGGRLAQGLPLAALVGLHAFRLPLELFMHQAAAEGVMPAQMSFGGWNFDIVTGASALLLAPFADRVPRWVVAGWSLMGTVLLAAILGIAMASTPLVAAFGSTPDRLNTFIAYPPFVWLPAVLVAAAIAGHVVVFRAVAARR